jgi:hypothetical protein
MEGLPVGNAGVRPQRADRQPDRAHLLLPGSHRHGSRHPEPIANAERDAVTHSAPDRDTHASSHASAHAARDGLPDRQADTFGLRHAIGYPNAAPREHANTNSQTDADPAADPVTNVFRTPRAAR